MKVHWYALLSCCLMFTVLAGQVQAEDTYSKPQELLDQSVVVLKRFAVNEHVSSFVELSKTAKAIFVVPKMLKGGFVIGGSGGSGVLVSRDAKTGVWSYPAFYTMGAISIGLQIGGESSQMILVIMTEKGMDSLLTSSFKLGAEVSVAAGPVGTGAKAATADILAYTLAKGAYGGATVEGAIIKTKDKWNSDFYGQKVTTADIIVRKIVTNNAADPLRQAVVDLAGGTL